MKYIKRLLVILGIIIALLIMLATPALAIGNPTSITFGTVSPYNMYQVFCNVLSTGDMLVASLPYIHYDGGDPTDYTGKQAFSFQLLSTDETTVLFQTPVVDYEDTIIGIYLTASQVTTAGISQSGSYWLRLAPNPALFTPTEGTNQKSAQLSASDWITTTLGNTQTYLRQWCINRALELQTLDAPTGGYTVYVNGVQYLNTLATQIFIAGIPGLDQMCPTLFQSSSSGIQLSIPANSYSTGTVSGTSGTPNVTGSGTLWTTITATDEFISIAGDSNNYQISSITDDTHLV